MTTEPTRRVLLVEDDRASRESLALFLERRGFEVLTARDGAEALDRIYAGVCVIVTDYAMPGMDGLALLREARVPRAARAGDHADRARQRRRGGVRRCRPGRFITSPSR